MPELSDRKWTIYGRQARYYFSTLQCYRFMDVTRRWSYERANGRLQLEAARLQKVILIQSHACIFRVYLAPYLKVMLKILNNLLESRSHCY